MEKSDKSKQKKRRYRLYITLDPDTHARINEYVDSNGYDMSKLLNLIVKKFLDAGGK